MTEIETADVASEDPSDVDFVEHVVWAIRKMAGLGRPTTTEDRRGFLLEDPDRPRPIFGYLGRRKLTESVEGKHSPRRLMADVEAALAGGDEILEVFLSEKVGTGRGSPRQGGRYLEAIHAAMQRWAQQRQLDTEANGRGYIIEEKSKWTLLLWPPLAPHADAWIIPADRHRWIHHMRSSQNFAVNLFGPLKLGMLWARRAWNDAFPEVTKVEFEYPHSGDPLREAKPPQQARTRVDVRLDSESRSATWLIEVKLTEPEFGGCSAGHDPKNPLRSASCDVVSPSLAHLQSHCLLSREKGRKYFELLQRPDSLIDFDRLSTFGRGGCPLRNDLYQLTRNLLLVQHVRAEEGRDARFAIVAPSRALNPPLHATAANQDLLKLLRSIVKDNERDAVGLVDFNDVVMRASADDDPVAKGWAAFMTERYLVPLRAGAAASGTDSLVAIANHQDRIGATT